MAEIPSPSGPPPPAAASERLGPTPLVPLPPQPAGVPWPVPDWPVSAPPAVAAEPMRELLDQAFDPSSELRDTYAVIVVHRGAIVAERYGGALPHADRAPEPVGPQTRLLSWSVAKSVLHSAVGILVADGRLSLDGPAPVPEWADPRDPRHAISVEDLLEMRDGLEFAEDYVDAGRSDTIEMLFGTGRDDVAAYASGRDARWRAGEGFSYSSGSSNVLAGILARTVGRGPRLAEWMRERLFGPIGADSFRLGFDAAGTWVASSYVYATARDWARFGELQLRDGLWNGRRVLPEGWVDHGRRPRSVDPDDGAVHGAHWWAEEDPYGTFRAGGYKGQAVVVSPALDLVVVRLGNTPDDRSPLVRQWRRRVVRLFGELRG